ncbi:MAG: hypothetical protein QW767_02415 [Thermoprotei archaeon]
MKISWGRVARGVVESGLVVFMLLYFPRLIEPYLAKEGIDASNLIHAVSAGSAVYIVAVLAATTLAGSILAHTRYRGIVTSVLGASTGFYFYRLFGSGQMSFSVTANGYPLSAGVGVEYLFILFELSALVTVAQGVAQLAGS